VNHRRHEKWPVASVGSSDQSLYFRTGAAF